MGGGNPPKFTDDQIREFCLKLWQRTGKQPSFMRCKEAGLRCDDQRFYSARTGEWMKANSIPVQGCHEHDRLRRMAISDEEIFERMDQLNAQGLYPSQTRSGFGISVQRYANLLGVWRERNGVPESPRGKRRGESKRASSGRKTGKRKAKIDLSKPAFAEQRYTAPVPKIDRPKPERPRAGSVEECVWLYGRSRIKREFKREAGA